MPTPNSDKHFLSHRDYRLLLSYGKSQIIYDITFHFTKRFLSKGDRTIDQMVQAARSGKQNIVEGSKAGTTSKESEIKLTNVARASLEELLDDYHDFLRVRDLPLCDKNSKEARHVRQLSRQIDGRKKNEIEGPGQNQSLASDSSHHPPEDAAALFTTFAKTRPADTVANIAICLIHQTNYLLDQQVRRLEQDFLEHGGLREAMTRARLRRRDR